MMQSEVGERARVVHGSRMWHEQCVGAGIGDQPVMSCSGLTLCGQGFSNADVRNGSVKLLDCTPRVLTCPACLEAMGR